jgi:hypothetical protein
MIHHLLQALGYMLAGATGAVANDLARSRLRHRQTGQLSCPHAWSLWEDCQLATGRYFAGEEILVPGQKRDCSMCGEREIRDLKANT